jgi:hypothetical protein
VIYTDAYNRYWRGARTDLLRLDGGCIGGGVVRMCRHGGSARGVNIRPHPLKTQTNSCA